MVSPTRPLRGILYSGGKLVRPKGRGPLELRAVEIVPNFISSAEGSALIKLGETQVICTASLEETVPPFLKGQGRGWISSEYSMIPRSTETRTPREAVKGKQSGRTMEIQRLIGRSLRAITDPEALGERTILIDCDVIRADGGTRTASITGSMVALGIALQKLVRMHVLEKQPLRDYVAAVSVGLFGGEVLLDLDYAEDSNADVDMNVIMTGAGQLVEVQATAETTPFSKDFLADLISAAEPAIAYLVSLQKATLKLALSSA
jgi:ribonuclease PH